MSWLIPSLIWVLCSPSRSGAGTVVGSLSPESAAGGPLNWPDCPLRRLVDNYQLSQEEVARQVGKSQSAVANKLRLLKLPTDVLDSLRAAGLSERHARALLRLEGPELQRQAAAHVIRHQLTVARTEEYVERLTRPAKSRRPFPLYRTKDVRLFLNTIQRGLSIMNSAGVAAQCGRQETDQEILLTIRIPKQAAPVSSGRAKKN